MLDVVEGTRPDVDDASRPGIDELLGLAHLDDGSLAEARVRRASAQGRGAFLDWLRVEAYLRGALVDDALPRLLGVDADQLAIARVRGAPLRKIRVARVEHALAIVDELARVCASFARALGERDLHVPLLPTRDDVVIADAGPFVVSAPYDWRLSRFLPGTLDGLRPWDTIGPIAIRQATAPIVDDAWCLGAIAYRLITSEGPIEAAMRRADSDVARLEAIRMMPIAAPRTLARELPARVDDLVMRMLAREVDEAFESYDDLQAEIAACRALFPDVTRADVGGLAAGIQAGLSLPPVR